MHFDISRLKIATDGLLDAAIGPRSWQDALNDIMAATQSKGVVIMPAVGRAPGIPSSENLSRPLERYFDEGWAPREYRMKGAPLLLKRRIIVDSDFLSPDEFQNEFFRFVRQFDLYHCALVGFPVGEDFMCCALHRGKDQAPFSAEEARELNGLSERFSLASSVARAVADAKAAGLADAFDQMRMGVIFFDWAGHVIGMNAAAERLMGPDLNVAQGEIRGRTAAETSALRRQVRAVTGHLTGIGGEEAVRVTREGKRPLILRFQKVHGFLNDFFSRAKAMAVIDDLDERPRDSTRLIESAFGFTPTEAAIAMLLAQGEGIKEIAELRDISYETARKHMKSIFAKAGVRRQSELVSLILKIR